MFTVGLTCETLVGKLLRGSVPSKSIVNSCENPKKLIDNKVRSK
tara:strand:+ start:2265 stop:2396 length:132 start_codon:yes stop_codon:yes gene_type:complete